MTLKTFKQLRERIKSGSGERMRKPGSKGSPTKQDFKDSMSEDIEELFEFVF